MSPSPLPPAQNISSKCILKPGISTCGMKHPPSSENSFEVPLLAWSVINSYMQNVYKCGYTYQIRIQIRICIYPTNSFLPLSLCHFLFLNIPPFILPCAHFWYDRSDIKNIIGSIVLPFHRSTRFPSDRPTNHLNHMILWYFDTSPFLSRFPVFSIFFSLPRYIFTH